MSMPSFTEVRDFLVEYYGNNISNLSKIGQGEWSHAYSYQIDEKDFVIRFSFLQDDFQKDQYAETFCSPSLIIPKVIAIGKAFNGFFAISEQVYGKALDELDEVEMKKTQPSLFTMLDALRSTDISSTQGFGMWDTSGNAPKNNWKDHLISIADDNPRLPRWHEKLRNSSLGEGLFMKGYKYLVSIVENCPEERYLVHSDLLNGNVLVSDNKIAAVIDWGNSLYGDFLYDLAWFTFWAPWYPAMNHSNFPKEALAHYHSIGLAVPNFEERLRCCQVHIGLDSQVYKAFKEDWKLAEEVGKQTIEVAENFSISG